MTKVKYTLVRNLEFGGLIETFLVFSVVSIVAIRVFLNLTGFPQLGGDGLHIAHMLWGGLIMLIVLGIVLIFLNLEIRKFAAIFGGIGFGVFIDEIGKFVTGDNNYFFERSEEHTSELQSHSFISYAVFCLKKKKKKLHKKSDNRQ